MATAKKGGAVAKRPNTSVVSIKDAIAAQAAANAKRVSQATGKTVKVSQDKQFTLPDGRKCTEFQAVIIDFVAMNRYYESAYDKDSVVPPNCFAINPVADELAPSENSPDRQGDEDGMCAGCPMNQFGTARTGNGKACDNRRRLALVDPEADSNDPLWQLEISPAAIREFDGFVSALAAEGHIPVMYEVTIGFDHKQTYPRVIIMNPTVNENLEAHFARQEEARRMLLVEPDVTQQPTQKPTKQIARKTRAR